MEARTYDQWLNALTIDQIRSRLLELGVREVVVKVGTAGQSNSKNGIWLGTDLTDVSMLPSGEVKAVPSTSKKRRKTSDNFQAPVDMYWLAPPNLAPERAPQTKLIFYTQYPEVRLSGFLQGCPGAPSHLLDKKKRGGEDGRVILLAPSEKDVVYGLVLPPESQAATEILEQASKEAAGIRIWALKEETLESKDALVARLKELYERGFVDPVKLNKEGLVPYRANNRAGYTLEAHLGIEANSDKGSDFEGWEIKAVGGSKRLFEGERLDKSVLTLMTPGPNSGLLVGDKGKDGRESLLSFMLTFGHVTQFGKYMHTGNMKVGEELLLGPKTAASSLKQNDERGRVELTLEGYRSGGEYEVEGGLALQLLDPPVEGARWSFSVFIDHWKKKHRNACYVPYLRDPTTPRSKMVKFSNHVLLGEGTRFTHFVDALAEGRVFYDPGSKIELRAGGTWKYKPRHQFRTKVVDLPSLYDEFSRLDVSTGCSELLTPL